MQKCVQIVHVITEQMHLVTSTQMKCWNIPRISLQSLLSHCHQPQQDNHYLDG